MRKWRLTRKAWVVPLAALVAIGIVVALAFYVRGFQRTGNDPIALPTDSPAAGAPHGSSAPSKHPGKHARGTPERERVRPFGAAACTRWSRTSNRPSRSGSSAISCRPARISLTARSGTSARAGLCGPGSRGRPKYAIIWIKGAKDGTSVSCSITIDGKVVDRQRTRRALPRLQACSG